MTSAFDRALAGQLQQLLARMDGAATQIAQPLDPGDAGAAGFSLSAEQVLGVMAGNDDWVQGFERQIEARFTALGDRVVAHWMQHTDKEIRRSLQDLAETAIGLFQEGEQAKLPLAEVEEIFQGGDISRRLEGLVARSARRFLRDVFTSTRKTTMESQRSREETERFRSSRGQVQAELSRELSRGQRYQ